MLPLVLHPLVEVDIQESAAWYARAEPGLEEHFLNEVRERIDALPADALLYAVRFEDIRRVNLITFKHGIFYFVAENAVVVLAIFHGHRDSEAELQRRREKYG